MQEFVTWFVWLGLFALLQRTICRDFPGIRSVFRMAFFGTTVFAVAPALWVLIRAPYGAPGLLHIINHYFGVGVYAQTSLQALIQLQWLAAAQLGIAMALRSGGFRPASESKLLARLAALSQAVSVDPPSNPRDNRR